jgi:ribosomal protein S18 acetylase RimI-like enzyme
MSHRENTLDITIETGCAGVDWQQVSDTLREVGMAWHDPELHRKAFENSHTTLFVYHGGRLIGFGRAISDGAYQAAVYDVAVLPEFQGQGIGKTIVGRILSRLPHCNVILYAAPGREGFYEKLGFRRLKTGMALFRNGEAARQKGITG